MRSRIYDRWNRVPEVKDRWRRDNRFDYGLIKQSIAAVIIFTIIYGVHISNTTFGQWVDSGVRSMLSKEPDWAILVERASRYVERHVDLAALRQVKATMTKPADPLQYMTKPISGSIVVPYGRQANNSAQQALPPSEGIDFLAPVGASVRASGNGSVKSLADNPQHGKMLVIDHGLEVETVYGNLGEVLVKQGDLVTQGQVVAKVGNIKSGGATSTLYFEVREKGKPVDPATRLRGEYPVQERR